jgi:hypothetical protein
MLICARSIYIPAHRQTSTSTGIAAWLNIKPNYELVNWSLRAARYRWAELLRRIYEVDPLACPRCAAPMRIVAVITDPAVITRILVHRARRSPPVARRSVQPCPRAVPCPNTPDSPGFRPRPPTRCVTDPLRH